MTLTSMMPTRPPGPFSCRSVTMRPSAAEARRRSVIDPLKPDLHNGATCSTASATSVGDNLVSRRNS